MLVPLAIVLLAAFANAEPAINEARPHSNRPGRFLSLPVPQKCANRKCLLTSCFNVIAHTIALIAIMKLRKEKFNFIFPNFYLTRSSEFEIL